MGWLERALALLFLILGIFFVLDFCFPKLPLMEEVCPRCIYTRRTGLIPPGCRCGDCPPGCTDGTWCKTYPYNRVCPTCGYKWEDTSYSLAWIPNGPGLLGMIVVVVFGGAAARTWWLARRPQVLRLTRRSAGRP